MVKWVQESVCQSEKETIRKIEKVGEMESKRDRREKMKVRK